MSIVLEEGSLIMHLLSISDLEIAELDLGMLLPTMMMLLAQLQVPMPAIRLEGCLFAKLDGSSV